MKISLLGFLLGMLLLVVPFYVCFALDLRRMRRLLVSTGFMVAAVAVTGGATWTLLQWNNAWLTVLAGVVMTLIGCVLTLKKARLKLLRLFVPLAAGSLAATIVVGFYVLFLVLGLKNPVDARFFVPIFGLLTGCSIGVNARGLQVYYMGLAHHSQLYYYLIGNGANHSEATIYFMRRSFQAALTPVLRQMSSVVVGGAPVVMLVLVMAGTDVFTAAALQVLLFVVTMAAAFGSLFVALMVGRRFSFDAYERLRPVKATPVKAEEPADEASSASLSTPPHTDSESRPQAE